MSDNEPGPWAGEPDEVENEDGQVNLRSPNFGKKGETQYAVITIVKEEKDGTTKSNGTIFLIENGSYSDDNLSILTYDSDSGTMPAMGEALEQLKEGNLPDAAECSQNEEVTSKSDKGDKPDRKFNLWRFLGLKKESSGFYLPVGDADFDEMNEGTGPFGGIGPTILWIKGEEAGIVAQGARDVNHWMRENLK